VHALKTGGSHNTMLESAIEKAGVHALKTG